MENVIFESVLTWTSPNKRKFQIRKVEEGNEDRETNFKSWETTQNATFNRKKKKKFIDLGGRVQKNPNRIKKSPFHSKNSHLYEVNLFLYLKYCFELTWGGVTYSKFIPSYMLWALEIFFARQIFFFKVKAWWYCLDAPPSTNDS